MDYIPNFYNLQMNFRAHTYKQYSNRTPHLFLFQFKLQSPNLVVYTMHIKNVLIFNSLVTFIAHKHDYDNKRIR